ncbi:hypothetical protein HPP92_025663 [Vanilla planifolia]|uniref:Uncharacterized protein n=1 Tax=Vanilla planifolia TaxID=51239 RepID=A0A835U977_VANPL|nr:hypothetical protein HPP92_025663 [Vanilla planifolia]
MSVVLFKKQPAQQVYKKPSKRLASVSEYLVSLSKGMKCPQNTKNEEHQNGSS